MRKIYSITAAFVFLLCLFSGAFSDTPQYTEMIFPVMRNLDRANSFVILRFYETMPHVAYISAAEYLRLWFPNAQMIVEQTGPGVYELTSPTGKATVNTEKNTFESADFSAFTDLMGLVQEDLPNVYYDGMPFVRFAGIQTEPAEAKTVFDLSRYDIELFGDPDAVYFPFALISDMYSDLFYHHSGFNGEKVVMNYSNSDMTLTTVDPSYAAGLLSVERPKDLAAFSYNELCFAIDHFYGFPGRELIHDSLQQNGLDKTLENLGPVGELIKTYLLSENTAEYFAGLDGLYALLFDGGHTAITPEELFTVTSREEAKEVYQQYLTVSEKTSDIFEDIRQNKYKAENDFSVLPALLSLRNQAYGAGETYIRQGDTAVCVLNSFNSLNHDAWDAYYAGEGPLPTKENTDADTMVIFLDALYRAQADPEVRNLVLDISTNTGGSADIVMAIVSLLTGKSELRYENALTGQKSVITYAVDRNFDGFFDEKDADVHFDLNFAVLTSKCSFSGANLFSSIMHDADYPILGERSGGGACAVAFLHTADGYDFSVSSYRIRLINDADENIDSGVPADILLADHDKKIEVLISGYDAYNNPTKKPSVIDDYRSFYNIGMLSRSFQDNKSTE